MGGSIPDMKVLLVGGESKAVKDLEIGDKVDTLHQNTMKRGEHEVTYVRVIESPLLQLTLSGKKLKCSEEDVFYSKARKAWLKATELVEGDTISQLDGEVEFQGSEKLGKGQSVELTIDDAHTYVCDGVLFHNKGGSPPTVIMPPPPPPPQIVTEVTPKETYTDAADFIRRTKGDINRIRKDRWDSGVANKYKMAERKAGIELQTAQNEALANSLLGERYDYEPQMTPSWASKNVPDLGGKSNLGDRVAQVIDALGDSNLQGSTSRDARIRPPSGLSTWGDVEPKAAPSLRDQIAFSDQKRVSDAQAALAMATAAKNANKEFVPVEYEEPSWADRDWKDAMERWQKRSDPVVYDASGPTVKTL